MDTALFFPASIPVMRIQLSHLQDSPQFWRPNFAGRGGQERRGGGMHVHVGRQVYTVLNYNKKRGEKSNFRGVCIIAASEFLGGE